MGRKGKEMSPDLKKVAVDLFRNGEKISDIARVLQQPRSTISDIRIFREAGTVKNRLRSGRPPRNGRQGLLAVGKNCEN
jgi:transposase-like protein